MPTAANLLEHASGQVGETLGERKLQKREGRRCAPGDLWSSAAAGMVAAEAAAGGGVEEGVGESSSPPRDAAPALPAGSGGSGGAARDICGQVYERLVADGHEGASDPEFHERLVAHFARLPHRFDRFAGLVLIRTSFWLAVVRRARGLWKICAHCVGQKRQRGRSVLVFGVGLARFSCEVRVVVNLYCI